MKPDVCSRLARDKKRTSLWARSRRGKISPNFSTQELEDEVESEQTTQTPNVSKARDVSRAGETTKQGDQHDITLGRIASRSVTTERGTEGPRIRKLRLCN